MNEGYFEAKGARLLFSYTLLGRLTAPGFRRILIGWIVGAINRLKGAESAYRCSKERQIMQKQEKKKNSQLIN